MPKVDAYVYILPRCWVVVAYIIVIVHRYVLYKIGPQSVYNLVWGCGGHFHSHADRLSEAAAKKSSGTPHIYHFNFLIYHFVVIYLFIFCKTQFFGKQKVLLSQKSRKLNLLSFANTNVDRRDKENKKRKWRIGRSAMRKRKTQYKICVSKFGKKSKNKNKTKKQKEKKRDQGR